MTETADERWEAHYNPDVGWNIWQGEELVFTVFTTGQWLPGETLEQKMARDKALTEQIVRDHEQAHTACPTHDGKVCGDCEEMWMGKGLCKTHHPRTTYLAENPNYQPPSGLNRAHTQAAPRTPAVGRPPR